VTDISKKWRNWDKRKRKKNSGWFESSCIQRKEKESDIAHRHVALGEVESLGWYCCIFWWRFRKWNPI